MGLRRVSWFIPGLLVSLLIILGMLVAGYVVIIPTLAAFVPELLIGLGIAFVMLIAFTVKHWWHAL